MLLSSSQRKKTCCSDSIMHGKNAVKNRDILSHDFKLHVPCSKGRAAVQDDLSHIHCPETDHLDLKENTAPLSTLTYIKPPILNTLHECFLN